MMQYVTVSSQLPKVGYIKGVDVLMLGCLLFLAIILLEYTILMFLLRDKKNDAPAPSCFHWCKPKKQKEELLTMHNLVMMVDSVLRWVVLLLFIAFITIYFLASTGVIMAKLMSNAAGFVS